MNQAPHDTDVIIIGSGISGLTAGLLLARSGKRVTLLEQHDRFGGWCQTFNVHGHAFCPGLHYIGECAPGERMCRFFSDLGLAEDLEWMEMNPRGYDHLVSPFSRFDFPKGRGSLAEVLHEKFPEEIRGIDRYIETCRKISLEWDAAEHFGDGLRSILSMPWKAPTILRYAFSTFADYTRSFTKNPILQHILGGQWLDSALPPSQLSGVLQAIIVDHYIDGAYFPKDGPRKLVSTFVRHLRRHHAEMQAKAGVARILIEGHSHRRKIRGVLLHDGTEIRANNVISTVDPHITYERLIGREWLDRTLRWRLSKTRYSCSCAYVFAVLDCDPRELGLDSGNLWYDRYGDTERSYRETMHPRILQEQDRFPFLFIHSDSLKDPLRKKSVNEHTLTLCAILSEKTFSHVDAGKYGERSAGYQALKEHTADMILRTAEDAIPGLRKHLIAYETSTPLTNMHYIPSVNGSIYGTEKNIFSTGPFAYPTRTGIDGLFLAGHSTCGHGIIGAGHSGRLAAAAVLGCRSADFSTGSCVPMKIYPAESMTDAIRAHA